MSDTFGVLEAWNETNKLPISWHLSQRDRRVHCFLEWLSELTDSESLLVLETDQSVLGEWNADERLRANLLQWKTPWKQESLEGGSVFQGGWIQLASGRVALGVSTSVTLDRSFFNTISDMLVAVLALNS